MKKCYNKIMYISEGIDDFIESLEVEGGRSKKTAENYQLYLERFIEFSGDILVKKLIPSLFESIVCGSIVIKMISEKNSAELRKLII